MPLSDRDRRTLRIGGIAVGVILVGFLLFSLLTGGETAGPTGATGPGPGTTGPTGATGPSPSVQPTPVFAGRDPFSIPPGFTSGSPSSSPSPSGSQSPSPSGSQAPSPTPTQPGNGSSQTVGGRTVVLIDTFVRHGQDMAQVEINGTVYSVSEGESFGPGGAYELRVVSGNCATFLYGDESFTLCLTPEK